ncbi:hypothetical protein D3261_03205 [Halococcus sp. IIIV-5B]|nr:hypothetical protein D3261_03205 [Halococcus sp. IIIV-5B]
MLPLQIPGMPGGPEVFVLLAILIVICYLIGRWVYRDAKKHGSGWAWQWGVAIGILFFVGLVPGIVGVVVYWFVVR